MLRFVLLMMTAVSTATVSMAAAAEENGELIDPEVWYADQYAPLWANEPGKNIDALLGFYTDHVRTHETSGAITVIEKARWLKEPMEGWLENDGWLTATLLEVQTTRINKTTASFKASWLDRYKTYPAEVSCGWYLADWLAGQWTFTAYADIECRMHQLKTKESE